VAALPAGDRKAWRTRLGVGPGELLLVHLGFLTPAKGMGTILRALAALHELEVPFKLVVVGEGSETSSFRGAVAQAGLGSQVAEWGWATPEDLGGIVAAADLGLVPRYPTAGETSAAVLRFLAAGTPVVVAGFEQFLELPAEAALRVPPGSAGVADLIRHVARLTADKESRQRSRRAARKVWEDGGHAPELAARALAAAVGEIAGELAS
jgi:glycosyltransferase involved in cell wall biosynthesis